MIKYYCDICDSEITSEGNAEVIGLKLGTLDFTNKVIHLCDSCYPKLKEAKESLYDTYLPLYTNLDSTYFSDIKNYILNDVDPEPANPEPDPQFDDVVLP